MPKIKIDKVISFSSEDTVHSANNLLTNDPAKKWKSSTPGETTLSAVLQLEQACKITNIDIGNEHSAYIEILAARSTNGDEFKVLLGMSSFMSALDARQSTNVNKVRMFSSEQLSKPECDQKWDRIKIVCTQPFNKHVQYGLSFITIHSSDKVGEIVNNPLKIGKFTLRPDSPEEFSIGSMFAKRKDTGTGNTLTAATAIRQASSSTTLLQTKSPLLNKLKQSKNGSPTRQTNNNSETPKKERNRNDILYTRDEEDRNDKIDKLVERKQLEKEKLDAVEKDRRDKEREKRKLDEKVKRDKEEEKLKKEQEEIDRREKITRELEDRRLKQEKEDERLKKRKNGKKSDEEKDLEEGNKNEGSLNKRKVNDTPTRRNKKLKMTKKGKPFELLLEGVVFVISGIQNPDRADIRSQAISMGAKYKADWDKTCTHLICAFVNTPKFTQVKGKGKIVKKNWILDCYSARKRLPWRRFALDRNDQGVESEEEVGEESSEETEESSDVEFLDNGTISQPSTTNINNSPKSNLPKLDSFFLNKLFYIDKNLQESDIQLLTKYIIAYNGNILDEITQETKLILTSLENVIDLKPDCPEDAKFIATDWIWECHNQQKCVSPTDFLML